MINKNDTPALARRLRGHALRMTGKSKSSHIGSCLSIADILAVLYGQVLNIDPQRPSWPDRDRLIVSKGHAAAIVYAALAETGFIPVSELDSFQSDGSRLSGHVTTSIPGVEFSTGSLGHGLPVAAGLAFAAKKSGALWRTYCILSDGEMDEGSNWEAIQFAQHHNLQQLVAIIDYNKIQSFGSVEDVSNLEPFVDKFKSFNWNTIEIDGHSHEAIASACQDISRETKRPTVIIANTIKGKGVSFMENRLEWHYRSVNDAQLLQAIDEIGSSS